MLVFKSSTNLCSWRPHTCSECVAGCLPPHLASHPPQHPPRPLHSLLLLLPQCQHRCQQQTLLLLLLLLLLVVLLNKTPLLWQVTCLLLLQLLLWLSHRSLRCCHQPAGRFVNQARGQCKICVVGVQWLPLWCRFSVRPPANEGHTMCTTTASTAAPCDQRL